MGYTKESLMFSGTATDIFELLIEKLTEATDNITAGEITEYSVDTGVQAETTLTVFGMYSIAASCRTTGSGTSMKSYIDLVVSYGNNQLGTVTLTTRSAGAAGQTGAQKLRFIVADNSNALVLRFTDLPNFNTSYINQDLLFEKSKKIFAINSYTGSQAASRNYLSTDGTVIFAETGNTTLIYDRLGYALTEPGKIELIESKVFTSSGIKSEEITSLYDSSTVAVDGTYPVNGVNYYAVDEHTVMVI